MADDKDTATLTLTPDKDGHFTAVLQYDGKPVSSDNPLPVQSKPVEVSNLGGLDGLKVSVSNADEISKSLQSAVDAGSASAVTADQMTDVQQSLTGLGSLQMLTGVFVCVLCGIQIVSLLVRSGLGGR